MLCFGNVVIGVDFIGVGNGNVEGLFFFVGNLFWWVIESGDCSGCGVNWCCCVFDFLNVGGECSKI